MDRVVIMGAAGRDFHDFNVVFRADPETRVVAFTRTAGQNLGELGDGPARRYPPSLAGEGYDDGIPIVPEDDLESVIQEQAVDEVVLSYSDVSHEHVMHQASRALAAGADFRLIGPDSMMLSADVPVVAIDAVRTGCGKSQAARALTGLLRDRGYRPVVVREPMPYGDLEAQAVLRFETLDELDEHEVTFEEREEFEHHIEREHVVYAGVDYAAVLDRAEAEADVIVWDGGNNELPFYRPDLHFVLADPHRAGDELVYHPGETNLRIADVVVINKENTADSSAIATVERNVRSRNPTAEIVHADSVVSVAEADVVDDARVLAVEDGPTVTHGGATLGAATIAAEQYGAAEIVDPEPVATGSIRSMFEKYPHLGPVLPAMGYSKDQIADLEVTINRVDCDVVLVGTPFNLGRLIDIDKPTVRVTYEIVPTEPTFETILDRYTSRLSS